jgi:hypothetical protein
VDEVIPAIDVVVSVFQVFITRRNVADAQSPGEENEELGCERCRVRCLFGERGLKLLEALGVDR